MLDLVSQSVQYQFSSVQWRVGVPRRPDHLRRKRSGRHGAAQLAWLDERCWHGLVIPSAARRARARPASDEFWRYGVLARQGPVKAAMADGNGWRSGRQERGRAGRGRLPSARHTLPARTISRMRVRAAHRRLQHDMGAAAEVLAQDAEKEQDAERERRQMAEQGARRGSAMHEDPALPFGEREHEPNCARAFRPRAPLSRQTMSPAVSPPIPHSLCT